MKITIPKEIADLGQRITAAKQERDTIAADIARAEEASQQAERITAEIEAVSRERAQRKAMAFVSRLPADLAELDKQMAELESANRSALEDGTAAAMAAAMLKEKLAQCEEAISNFTEQRRQLALSWLDDRREKALDRYIKLLDDLGPLVAEMRAADKARTALGYLPAYPGLSSPSEWLLAAVRSGDTLPVPSSRHVPVNPDNPMLKDVMVSPVRWMRASDFADREFEQVIAELQGAGLLPT